MCNKFHRISFCSRKLIFFQFASSLDCNRTQICIFFEILSRWFWINTLLKREQFVFLDIIPFPPPLILQKNIEGFSQNWVCSSRSKFRRSEHFQVTNNSKKGLAFIVECRFMKISFVRWKLKIVFPIFKILICDVYLFKVFVIN